MDKTSEKNISRQDVAQYLLDNGLALTALELFQESYESGDEIQILKDHFDTMMGEVDVVKDVTDFADKTLRKDKSGTFHSRVPDEILALKDDQIAVLEYELRISKHNLNEMKDRYDSLINDFGQEDEKKSVPLDGDVSPKSTTRPRAGSNLGRLASMMTAETAPISSVEKRILNYVTEKYLIESGLTLSAITLSDEVDDQDLSEWSDVGVPAKEFPPLHQLVRMALKSVDRGENEKIEKETIEKSKLECEEMKSVLMASQQKQTDLENDLRETRARVKTLEPLQKLLAEQKAETATLQIQMNEMREGKSPMKNFRVAERLIERTPTTTSPDTTEAQIQTDVISMENIEDGNSATRDAVMVIADKLPHIVPNVLLNKRDELIDVILSVILAHPDPKIRDVLTHMLFNLIKTPDENQRKMIMDGCVSLAKKIGYQRIEEELLPQCWEQITHPRAERRILVAQSCGILAPHVRTALRHSLLLSILQQLVDDASPLVRTAVCENIALLISTIEEGDEKYGQIQSLVIKLCDDTDHEVASLAKSKLLPNLASWSVDIGRLCSGLLDAILNEAESKIKNITQNEGGDHREPSIIQWLNILSNVLSRIRAVVLSEAPTYSNSHEVEAQETFPENSMELEAKCDSVAIEQLGDVERLNRLQHNMDFLLSDTHYDTSWPSMDWLSCELIPRLGAISSTVADTQILPVIIDVVWKLCGLMGRPFASHVARPIFQHMLDSQDFDNEGNLQSTKHVYPTFLCGVLPWCGKKELNDVLKLSVINFSMEESGWNASDESLLLNTFENLASRYEEWTLELLWDLIIHPAASVRRSVVSFFTVLIPESSMETIDQRILPAFITLANDPDSSVRCGVVMLHLHIVVRSLSSVAMSKVNDNVMDKLIIQYQAALEEAIQDDVMLSLLLTEFSKLISSVSPRFRDQFLLPEIIKIADSMKEEENVMIRTETTHLLYSCYLALNGAMLSKDTLTTLIIPSIRRIVETEPQPDKELMDKFEMETFQIFHTLDVLQILKALSSEMTHALTSLDQATASRDRAKSIRMAGGKVAGMFGSASGKMKFGLFKSNVQKTNVKK